MTDKKANIALIGAGWWSQGWHLPCLDRNEGANLVAIVDTSSHPKSNLNPDLESLETLKHKYNTQIYSSISELLNEMGPELDGVLIATPHATHYAIGKVFMEEIDRRKEQGEAKPLHILMEKPMSTDVQHSLLLYKLVKDHAGPSQFWVNHSANFRTQAKMAREAISSGRIGKIRHITGFFASPLMWIFDDPSNKVSVNLGHLLFLHFLKPTNILRGLERAYWWYAWQWFCLGANIASSCLDLSCLS